MQLEYLYGILITARGQEIMVRLGSLNRPEGYAESMSLNELGGYGWEMCGAFLRGEDIYIFFKRRMSYPTPLTHTQKLMLDE